MTDHAGQRLWLAPVRPSRSAPPDAPPDWRRNRPSSTASVPLRGTGPARARNWTTFARQRPRTKAMLGAIYDSPWAKQRPSVPSNDFRFGLVRRDHARLDGPGATAKRPTLALGNLTPTTDLDAHGMLARSEPSSQVFSRPKLWHRFPNFHLAPRRTQRHRGSPAGQLRRRPNAKRDRVIRTSWPSPQRSRPERGCARDPPTASTRRRRVLRSGATAIRIGIRLLTRPGQAPRHQGHLRLPTRAPRVREDAKRRSADTTTFRNLNAHEMPRSPKRSATPCSQPFGRTAPQQRPIRYRHAPRCSRASQPRATGLRRNLPRTRTSWWSKNDPGRCTDPYHRTR